MKNVGAKKRVGYVRIRGLNWKMNSELILKKIGQDNVVEIVQPREDGKDLDAQDVVFVHPDFDEVNEGDPIPLYTYDFSAAEFRRSA